MNTTANATAMTAPVIESVATLRREFRRIQDAAGYVVEREVWRAAVVAELAKVGATEANATPSQWVDAAECATVVCPKCKGTGEYYWGAYDISTKRMSHKGDCYQCDTKGRQDMDDFFRNKAYIHHAIVAACRM